MTPKPDTSSSSAGGSDGAGGDPTSTGVGGSSGDGGGATDDGQAGYVSGSRLKARYFDGADGSKYFTGMMDTQLNVPCEPKRYFSDQSYRCLPAEALQGFFFTDPACTQGFTWSVDVDCEIPSYALQGNLLQCSGQVGDQELGYAVRPVGSPIAKPTQAWAFNGFTCVAAAVPNFPNYYAVGAGMEASDFVEMSPATE